MKIKWTKSTPVYAPKERISFSPGQEKDVADEVGQRLLAGEGFEEVTPGPTPKKKEKSDG